MKLNKKQLEAIRSLVITAYYAENSNTKGRRNIAQWANNVDKLLNLKVQGN